MSAEDAFPRKSPSLAFSSIFAHKTRMVWKEQWNFVVLLLLRALNVKAKKSHLAKEEAESRVEGGLLFANDG